MTESGPRRGLWGLMNKQRSDEAAAPSPAEPSPSEPPPPPLPIEDPAPPPEPVAETPPPAPIDRRLLQLQSKPPARGLWALMQKTDEAEPSSTPEVEQSGTVEEAAAEPAEPIIPVKKIDRRLLQRAPRQFEEEETERPESLGELRNASQGRWVDPNDAPLELARLDEDSGSPPPEPLPDDILVPIPAEISIKMTAPVGGLCRSALWSVILGGISVPVSLVAIYPAIWSRIPPSLFGFAALGLGFVAQGEIKRTRGRMKGLALSYVGIALGLLGMFAGPAIYTPLDLYGHIANAQTSKNLQQIGTATEAYINQSQTYPAGGLFKAVKEGEPEPLHGWMTLILPYLPDGSGLHQQIDLTKPYFDPVNEAVMRQTIPTFLATGGSRALIQRRFGPAHFAGVGGLISLPEGRMAHAGVFDVNSDVNRDDIVDGQSNTLMAGEISINYPAWGEPHNWRQIGKGLNRDPQGFGNARHTGAMFLMTDGSVRYLSNRTDPRVLQALQTRDGEDTP